MTRLAIRMPKMSMTMTEGEVSQWFAEVGDTVSQGDVVCEVMTDKVDMEVESTVSGTLLEITVASGMVDVGEPIGWVEGADDGPAFGDLLAEPSPEPAEPEAPPDEESPRAAVPAEAEAAPASRPPASDTRHSPVAAVPRARGLARERGVDLATVAGGGKDGLITVEDVETASAPAPRPPDSGSSGGPRGAPTDRRTAVRTAVARKMTPSALIPQFTVWREIPLDAADAVRQGLSWTTVLLRAYAGALREVPELRSRWEDDRPTDPAPPAVALAVATDRGLLVPTFLEPDLGPPEEVDAEIKAVVRSAHSGRLDPSYLGAANGSLSNLGGLGVDRFQALLTPPQGSVLSLGSIRKRPVAVPGGVGLALTVEAGLTVDHRIADGAHGADLLERFARRVSGPL